MFRRFSYADMTRPLPANGFSASVAKADANATEVGRPVALVSGSDKDRSTLEAPMPGATLPLSVKLHVTFKPGDADQAFDFTFAAYSKER
jgi:hypothetical protein